MLLIKRHWACLTLKDECVGAASHVDFLRVVVIVGGMVTDDKATDFRRLDGGGGP